MTEKIKKTDAEWRKQLTPEQYHVTHEHGTERALPVHITNPRHPGRIHACVVGIHCSHPIQNSSRARVCPRFMLRLTSRQLRKTVTIGTEWCVSKRIAPNAMHTSGMSLTMDLHRPDCVTA